MLAYALSQTFCKGSVRAKTWRRSSRPFELNEIVVRPSGFEPPTFCSGEKRSMCILLIPIAAMVAFRANRRRIKAAVDERLMKGFSGSRLSESLLRLPSPVAGGPVSHEDEIQVQLP